LDLSQGKRSSAACLATEVTSHPACDGWPI